VSSVINTNVMSLNAQRNMLKSSGELANSMQRLSTGLRINSAKDDAAGLAISERMSGQINGMGQAMRNANDGISLSQTAEGALQAVTDSLQRVRQLAVQSANSSNTVSDRAALNTEAQSLLKEISRVAGQTQFNGQNLTDGTFGSAIFQIGANEGQTITVSALTNATTSALGRVNQATTADATSLNNTNTDNGAGRITSTSDTTDIADATATATGTGIKNLEAAAEGTLKITGGDGTVYDVGALAAANSVKERMGQVVEGINNIATSTGVSAYVEGDQIKLTSDHDIKLSGSDADGVLTGLVVDTGGDGTTVTAAAAESDGLDVLDISSYAGSNLAIQQVDAALQKVNSDRASMGALQSRFQSAVTTLQTHSENLSAARSQIRDADFASETANLTRAQILQQAGVAMLSQANSAPQSVLSLLKG
jgi:flagellin